MTIRTFSFGADIDTYITEVAAREQISFEEVLRRAVLVIKSFDDQKQAPNLLISMTSDLKPRSFAVTSVSTH
jgi:hypothetical protein